VAGTGIAGTVFIACGAFWLSFTALTHLAVKSGIDAKQAWAWPLIVDGIIVVATVSVVALAGRKGVWYPWLLLMGGALVSVTANAIQAAMSANVEVPHPMAAAVAAVPPIVLLAITHLTVVLTRSEPNPRQQRRASTGVSTPASLTTNEPGVPGSNPPADRTRQGHTSVAPSPQVPILAGQDSEAVPDGVGGKSRTWKQTRAIGLHADGLSNRAIASELKVHPTTVGRWLDQGKR